jgi:acyl carrier protein
MQNTPNKEQVTDTVIQIFIETVGFIQRNEVSEHSDFVHDFKIIDDDLTAFIMEVDKHFALNSTQKDWDNITKIDQIVDLVLFCQTHPDLYPPLSPLKNFRGWLAKLLNRH